MSSISTMEAMVAMIWPARQRSLYGRKRRNCSARWARKLRKLPAGTRTRIVKGLRVLEEDPFRPRPKADIRVIEGTDPRKYRIRIGDYRAIYAVVEREVKVVEIFIRGRGYQ